MKSTFFHIGINRTLARKEGLQEPRVGQQGSVQFVPLPDHHDPDFGNMTYGDPWGRLNSFAPGDIAWFIESATVSSRDWGYYLIAYFVIEDVYARKSGKWNKPIPRHHLERIAKNVHECRGDSNYAIIVGSEKSKTMFQKPFRISKAQDPYLEVKALLGLPLDVRATGYWFKTWFPDEQTNNLRRRISHYETN